MSYASRARLADDVPFRDRCTACCQEQALIFVNDGRADISALARQIIVSNSYAAGLIELVALAPNFKDVTDQTTIADGDILAAVQANWPTYAGVMFPPSEPVG